MQQKKGVRKPLSSGCFQTPFQLPYSPFRFRITRRIQELNTKPVTANSTMTMTTTESRKSWKPSSRACLKIHSRHLHAPLRGIFGPNSLNVAHYAAFIWAKSPTKCDVQLPESNFQTRSGLGTERRNIGRKGVNVWGLRNSRSP